MTNDVDEALQLVGQVSFHQLHMIAIEHEFQICSADVIDDLCSLRGR